MSGSVNWTNRQVAERGGSERPHKYNARKKEVDGILFDSTREAKRYQELKFMEKCGSIHDLRLQPRFVIQQAFLDSDGKMVRKMEYVADFQYRLAGDTRDTVEDCKGFATEAFKLKWKLVTMRFPERFVIWK